MNEGYRPKAPEGEPVPPQGGSALVDVDVDFDAAILARDAALAKAITVGVENGLRRHFGEPGELEYLRAEVARLRTELNYQYRRANDQESDVVSLCMALGEDDDHPVMRRHAALVESYRWVMSSAVIGGPPKA